MPQVKGNANWMINPRRLTSDPPKRTVGIDNSDAHIENEVEEENMRREVENLNLQRYRVMTDRVFELKQTKKDVSEYQLMKTRTTHNHAYSLSETRRKEKEVLYGTPTGSSKLGGNTIATASSSSVTNRPQTGRVLPTQRKGFSHIEIDDSDDDDYYYSKNNRTSSAMSTTVLVPKTTAHPSRSRRRPKTSHPARSRRQIRESLEDEFSNLSKPNRRPKTTLGFIREEDHGKGSADGADPERELYKLKHLDNIDLLSSSQLRQRDKYMRQIRNKRLEDEQKLLTKKLDHFYERLDRFKTESNRRVLGSTVLF